MWRVFLCDTMSGSIGAEIDVPAFSWSMSVSDCSFDTTADKGTGEGEASGVTLPWTSIPGSTPQQRGGEVASGRRGMVLCWDDGASGDYGIPIIWGAIGPRTDTFLDTTFSLQSVMEILGYRYALNEGVFGASATVDDEGEVIDGTTSDHLHYSLLSQRAVACAVGQMCTGNKPGGSLPIDWSYLGESGYAEYEYYAYDIQNISGAGILDDIASVDGGPDMQFRPYISDSGAVRLSFVAGSDADVYLGQDTEHYIPLVNDITVAHSGPCTRVYATGAGSEDEQLCYLAQDLSLQQMADPRPLYETTASYSGCEDLSLLKSYGAAQLAASKVPLCQVTCTVDVSQLPLGSVWPGEVVTIPIDDFPTLPSGDYSMRLMSMSGDEGTSVTLTFDPFEDPTY